MDIEKGIKSIDDEFIRLILDGEFELVGIGEYITTIECGGYHLNIWMSNGESSISTYHHADDPIFSKLPRYIITHISKKREIYRMLKSLVDPKVEAQKIAEKRKLLKKIQRELGEVDSLEKANLN